MTSSEIFDAFVAELHEHGLEYCILAGYDGYPDHIESDIDFVIRPEAAYQLPTLMCDVAERTGCRIVQAIRHETSACYFVLAKADGTEVTFFHPDFTGDYRRHGRLWLRSTDLLAGRQPHPQGFFVPAPEDAFIYYLIKRVDKRALTQTHVEKLARWYAESPEACRNRLATYWDTESCTYLAQALASADWESVARLGGSLADALNRGPRQESWRGRLVNGFAEMRRLVERVMEPTGVFVVFLGPDGCGKSTVIERVQGSLAPAFRGTFTFHLRPRLGQRPGRASQEVLAPHRLPPRGLFSSSLKLAYFLFDFGVGYWAIVWPKLVRSTLVISDRYYHDLLVDPLRFRFGLPTRAARMVAGLVPSPDVWIILDAPAEVLQARKQEVSYDEAVRQRQGYLELAASLKNAVVVDATKSIDQVVADVLDAVLKQMARRTTSRLSRISKAGG